mmetsp:Transcript_31333/g.52864  ORF Transcript_31333/g.52864 Transcript_31333/m.52864 type:complete len:271 (-) Transcript_31333:230-1042(-)
MAGMELGIYTFLGFACQAVGLETTTATRSAFLLYLNVKLVPFLAFLFLGRQISNNTWLSAFLALAGTCLLSTDGAPPNIGDLWCAAAALASACFILRLEAFSSRTDAAELNGVSFMTVAVLCGMWVAGDRWGGHLHMDTITSSSAVVVDNMIETTSAAQQQQPGLLSSGLLQQIFDPILNHPLPVVYLGLISTALCNYLQTLGQRVIPAERAAIIYSADPVYGAMFSWWLLGEQFGSKGFFGAGLILLGIFISSRDSKEEKDNSTNLETN